VFKNNIPKKLFFKRKLKIKQTTTKKQLLRLAHNFFTKYHNIID